MARTWHAHCTHTARTWHAHCTHTHTHTARTLHGTPTARQHGAHQHEQRVVHDAERAEPAAVVVDLLLELGEHPRRQRELVLEIEVLERHVR